MNEIIGKKGKRIAFLGNISHKKGPMLLIQAFNVIHKHDPEFTLHIGGKIDDPRYAIYLDHAIPELGLQDSVQYYGFVEKPIEWLKQFDWIICTSPLEGSPVGLLEALSQALSPLFYSFAGVRDQYPDEFIWKNFDELLRMIEKGPQDPMKIKKFVKDNYSLDEQLNKIHKIVDDLAKKPKKQVKNRKKSTVSAIIAVKNGEKTIERAINSLVNQTKCLQKIVVVDDGSTDRTVDIVKSFKETTIPIKLVRLSSSRWVFAARNKGYEHINSDYFFFLDADDFVSPEYVERLSEVLDSHPSVDVVYPDMIYFDEHGSERVFQVPEFDINTLMGRNFIAYASMQRTKRFGEMGGYSDYLNYSRNHLTEWELWLRYFRNGSNFKRLGLPLFYYFRSSESKQMSSNYETSKESMYLQMISEVADDKSISVRQNKERILLVCQGRDYLDESKVGFEIYTWAKPLEMNGKYKVYVFQYDVELAYFGHNGMIERLKNKIDLIKPKYIFHPTYKEDIPVDVWKEISKEYCTICWNSDDNWLYEIHSKYYNLGFRYAITTYPEIYSKMDHPGKILSQWAVNPFYFYPRKKSIDVSFCGQAYGNRVGWLKDLNVKCYGKGWDNGFVDFPKMAEILGQSKISVNFSDGADGGKQIKLRPFEICGSNALCLCEYVDGIGDWYEIDKEIKVFRTKEELKDLIEYYLEHDAEREEIAQAGCARTILGHTWFCRFEKIFTEIEERGVVRVSQAAWN